MSQENVEIACLTLQARTRIRHMATYRVAFDGKWQGKFDDLADAVEWAKAVSETGRTTWVVEHRALRLRSRLRATFPEERREEAEKAWSTRSYNPGENLPLIFPG